MHEAVEEMRPHIGFREAKATGQAFVISYEGEDPATTQKVTQRLADLMVEALSRGSVSEAQRNLEVAQNEEQKAAEEVDRASTAFATFLQLHPEFQDIENRRNAGGSTGVVALPTTAGKSAEPRDPVLASLQAQRAAIYAEIRAATGQSPDGAGHESKLHAAREARDQAERDLAAAKADLAAKKAKYTDDFPDVKVAKDKVASAQRDLADKDAALRAVDGKAGRATVQAPPDLQRKLDTVNQRIAQRIAELQKKPGGAALAQQGALGGVAEAAEYERLGRNLRLSRETYGERKTDLDKARLSSSVASAAAGDTLNVLDPAYLPVTPSKGDPLKTSALGVVAALAFAIFSAFARVMMNDTVIDEGDVEALKLVPVLGVLPKISRTSKRPGTQAQPGTA
jgi:hypothetical protein